jgi:hypothetical protein
MFSRHISSLHASKFGNDGASTRSKLIICICLTPFSSWAPSVHGIWTSQWYQKRWTHLRIMQTKFVSWTHWNHSWSYLKKIAEMRLIADIYCHKSSGLVWTLQQMQSSEQEKKMWGVDSAKSMPFIKRMVKELLEHLARHVRVNKRFHLQKSEDCRCSKYLNKW